MSRKRRSQFGFTMIELVVVVVLLGILAAIALPKYMRFTDDARSSVVEATGGSFSAGINMAHAKWELNEKTTAFIDLDGDGLPDTKFSSAGWPDGISADGRDKLSDLSDGGVMANDSCSQIMQNVITTTGLSFIAADESGKCTSGDFCARAVSHNTCEFIYRPTKEKIVYKTDTGKVFVE